MVRIVLTHVLICPLVQAVMMESSLNPTQLKGSSSMIFDMTGGNSAVRVRDSTRCSNNSSSSSKSVVNVELERYRVVA